MADPQLRLKQLHKLIEAIRESSFEGSKWDDLTMQQFCDELLEHGITTADEFLKRFVYCTQDHNPQLDFAWFWFADVQDLGDELAALQGVVIDWNGTWHQTLQHQFLYFRFDGTCFFLRRSHPLSDF